jgi:hypothetical protein
MGEPLMPKPGDLVRVKTAFGTYVDKRAITGVIPGDRFDIVRVCSESEWDAAQVEHRNPKSSPWPANDVYQPCDTEISHG